MRVRIGIHGLLGTIMFIAVTLDCFLKPLRSGKDIDSSLFLVRYCALLPFLILPHQARRLPEHERAAGIRIIRVLLLVLACLIVVTYIRS